MSKKDIKKEPGEGNGARKREGLSRREAALLCGAGALGAFASLKAGLAQTDPFGDPGGRNGRGASPFPRRFVPPAGPEVPERPTFFWAQLMYGSDQSWNPHPTACRSLIEIMAPRASVQASPERVDLRLDSPRLFRYPFLYWTGDSEFDPLPSEHLERLRLYLEMGGFLFVDDALAASGIGFDKSFQRELSRMFPGRSLQRLPEDHTVFQSYYLIDRVVGRTVNRPYLLGLDQGDLTMIVYSGNDMGGSWAKDRMGRWIDPVEPGGTRQRETSIRLGINIILYALCANYKKDLIHVPFISERRKGR